MYKKVFVGRSLNDLKSSPKLPPFSKVVVVVTDDVKYEAGDNSGQTLTVKIPWGTQAMANNLLKQYKGYRYQPYNAKGAGIDPAAEIGDGVTTATVYGGLFQQNITFGRMPKSDYSAPQEEQINHEFPFTPKRDRVVNRENKIMRSTLKVQAGLIAARVESVGGDRKSFGWELKDDHHSWFANGAEVVRFEKDNFKFEGTIKAKAGLIGGLEIKEGYLRTGNASSYFDVKPGEMFISPTGINLGGSFRVNNQGELVAKTGKFEGTVYAGSVAYGGDKGYFSGGGLTAGSVTGGLTGKISGGTITTANTVGGINTSLGYADYSNDVFSGISEPAHINATTVKAQSNFYFRNKQIGIDPDTQFLKVL